MTSTSRETHIAQLRAEYAGLHVEAMRRIRLATLASDAPDLADLQKREMDIDRALRALGTTLTEAMA